MQPDMALLWEVSIVEFIGVTMILGGAGAWMVGRSTALAWSGWGILAFYIFLLTVALRFIHFSLFGGSFFLPPEDFPTALYYGFVDYLVLMAFAAGGRLNTRRLQISRQYRAFGL